MSAEEQLGGQNEEEARAAYERELSRMTSADVIAQAAVSLLNIAALRLRGAPDQAAGAADLGQVRDAIDATGALLAILERTMANEVRPLRDALSQLQLAYASEVRAGGPPPPEPSRQPAPDVGPDSGPSAAGEGAPEGRQEPEGEEGRGPGPAESSGRLWIPGR